MKIRLRVKRGRTKQKKNIGHGFGQTLSVAITIIIALSWRNVVTLNGVTAGWSRSLEELFTGTSASATGCPHNVTIDILSIGSVNRLDYLAAQQNTFGSHCSVRNFFTATEKDDADPECESKLTNHTVVKISNFCRRGFKWGRNGQWFMDYMAGAYAFHRWLLKKKNPQGWVCAQTRPAQALFYTIEKYQKRNESFPDYLLIIDDDTYYNMKLFADHFAPMDSSEPIAVAGCRVRSPVHRINFTIPFGGYGTTVSKGWLEKLVKPISCPRDSNYCNAIQVANHIGEKAVFKDGMTIAELMYGYSTYQPFDQRDSWSIGFCLHSDWFIAYFTNFYNLSNHVSDPNFADVPYARLESLHESEINGGDAPHRRRICDFHSGNCHSMALACHYSNPTEMKAITDKVRQENPDEFKPFELNCTDCDDAMPKDDHEKQPIIDIASLVRNTTDFQAQEKVIGSDESVRSFFNISESNTPDLFCSTSRPMKLTVANNIASTCRSDQLSSPGAWLFEKLRNHYARSAQDIQGWACEQRRLMKGVSNLLLQYQQKRGSIELPDFLILLTDTTYFNVKIFHDTLRNIKNGVKVATGSTYNPSNPIGVAGCIRDFQDPSSDVTFRVPMLDFGIILNRAALEDLLKPIYCDNNKANMSPLCTVIQQSQVGERDVFKYGMTAAELMGTFATTNLNEDSMRWPIGMCFEAEWLFAYFIQFYTGEKAGTISPQLRLARANNPIHAYLEPIHHVVCQYSGQDCNVDAPYCSGISADQMLTYLRD